MKKDNTSEKKVKNKGGNGSGSAPAPATAPAPSSIPAPTLPGRDPDHYHVPEPSIPKEKPTPRAPSQLGVAADATLPWLRSLWEFGEQRPIWRGSYRWNDEDVKSLIDKAVAEARANGPLPWDTQNNEHDAQLMRKRAKLEEREELAKKKHDEDLAEMEEIELERANFHRNAHKPSKPFLAIILVTLFLALTLVPSFFDGLFFKIDNEQLGWLLSSIFGLAAAGCISYLVLGEYRHA